MSELDRKKRIEAMVLEIERRGGKVGLMKGTPDAVMEKFLQSVLDCPDCGETTPRRSH